MDGNGDSGTDVSALNAFRADIESLFVCQETGLFVRSRESSSFEEFFVLYETVIEVLVDDDDDLKISFDLLDRFGG
jgi:IS4 transposase